MTAVPEYAENNHWINILQIEPDVYGRSRESLMEDLQTKGIQTRLVWYPNHRQKPYLDCKTYKIGLANKLVETSLCLPSSSQLNEEDIAKIIEVLNG
jgi:perosamine synthetase